MEIERKKKQIGLKWVTRTIVTMISIMKISQILTTHTKVALENWIWHGWPEHNFILFLHQLNLTISYHSLSSLYYYCIEYINRLIFISIWFECVCVSLRQTKINVHDSVQPFSSKQSSNPVQFGVHISNANNYNKTTISFVFLFCFSLNELLRK